MQTIFPFFSIYFPYNLDIHEQFQKPSVQGRNLKIFACGAVKRFILKGFSPCIRPKIHIFSPAALYSVILRRKGAAGAKKKRLGTSKMAIFSGKTVKLFQKRTRTPRPRPAHLSNDVIKGSRNMCLTQDNLTISAENPPLVKSRSEKR